MTTGRAGAIMGLVLLLSGTAALTACAQGDPATRRTEAAAALRRGDLAAGFDQYRRLIRSPAGSVADRRTYLRALVEFGRVQDALAEIASTPDSLRVALATVRGEVLRAAGRRAEALAAFRDALAAGADDRIVAQVGVGTLLIETGADREGRAQLEDAVALAAGRSDNTPVADAALAEASRILGAVEPSRFQDALALLDRAIAKDSGFHAARVQLGDLFLAKYNGPEAAALYRGVLAENPKEPGAWLGLARHAVFDRGDSARIFARRALDAAPAFPAALAFLAQLALESEQYPAADSLARSALAINPAFLPALHVLGASRWLAGDPHTTDSVRAAAFAIHPHDGAFYADLAEVAGRNRLYRAAWALADSAVRLDPFDWRARALRGTNALRLGEMVAGRADLTAAFDGDPYNLWTKNSLDLLDRLDRFPRVMSPRGRFAIYADSAVSPLLALYLGPLADEAYAALAARYGYEPPTPIRLEVYDSHADFSVRTIGLAGLGALGVSFGNVLAMDAPSARDRGAFNWGSTLWHEIAHVFTLGMTDHRVPRWFSEGLSVLEERRARPAWGARATPDFLAALEAGRLLPVSRLNDGFVRPAYPEQVMHAYYEASLVCEFLEERWGMPAILGMLAGYRNRVPPQDVLEQATGLSAGAFDQAFQEYLGTRFAQELAAVDKGKFLRLLAEGRTQFAEERWDQAAATFREAVALWPDYAGAGNPHAYLARIHHRQGRIADALRELRIVTRGNEVAWEENLLEADLLVARGDTAAAAGALDRLLSIRPGEIAVHERLAEYAGRSGDHGRAIRERMAVLASRPTDRAGAEYRLALAYERAGDRANARRAVLRALEIAPAYEAAQSLLLRLRTGGPP